MIRLSALTLSVAAHVGLSFALGAARGSDGDSLPSPSSTAILVYLNGPSEPVPIARAPQPGPPKYNESERQSGDRPVDAPRKGPLPTPHEEPMVPILLPVEPHYLPAKELTERPQVQQDVSPNLTLSLLGVSSQSVVLRLLINELGDVDRVEMDESELSEDAKKLLIQAFSKIKFHPGKLNDAYVKSQLRIEVTLEPTPIPVLTLER